MPSGKPLITANHVTLARLVPMPLITWWIYRGEWWPAIILGTIIGCTDFVDGYMARRQGPTVLGGLLDPIADKVFVALIYVPLADVGLIPAWACALMFVREFLVTALRSLYERRNLSMKTSYLGKVKTWTQMQGIGLLVVFQITGTSKVLTALLFVGVVAPLIAMGVFWLVKKKFWKGALVMSGSFIALLAVYWQDDPWLLRSFIMFLVVAMTWISGFDYLASAFKNLRGRGDFGRSDLVRLVGAIAVPVLIFAVMMETPVHAWPLLVIISLELAVGGLDNLLSHHQHGSGALPWGSRVGGVSALLGVALLLPDYATWLAVLAAALSTAGVSWEFWRGRDYYLDARLREKAPELARRAELRPQGS